MTVAILYKLAAVLLFAAGLYGLLAQPHLMRKILALNLMSMGVFLFLVSTAARAAPPLPDPVPHAMVITGIVVSVSATALALVLTARVHHDTGEVGLSWSGRRHPEQ